MLGAHLGAVGTPFDWGDPGSWDAVVNGRSSILFATIAGVSIALLSGGSAPATGEELARARSRVLARGVAVLLVGLALTALDTGIAVILPSYGALFLLALPAMGARPGPLLAAAALLALAMPALLLGLGELSPAALALLGNYPPPLWLAFLLAGMAAGRMRLERARTALALGGAGAGLAVLGYGGGILAARALGVDPDGPERAPGLGALATIEAHSGSPFEVVGSTGVALAVLAACLLAARVAALRVALFPLRALGSVALTAYTLQIVAIALLLGDVRGVDGDGLWLSSVLVALAAATAWVLLLGRGPLERGLSALADLAVSAREALRRPGQ